MLFNEPAPTNADLRFRIFSIPVRVHPMFWFMALILGGGVSSPVELFAWIGAVFVSILAHELGHSAVLRAFGHRPWIILHAMGGLACHQPGNTRTRGSGTLGQIAVSAAGPGAGFVLSAALALLLQAVGKHLVTVYFAGVPFPQIPHFVNEFGEVVRPLTFFELWSNDFIRVSVIWGLLNLLPIYPLDGGNIAREIVTAISPRRGIAISLGLSALIAAGIAVHLLLRSLNSHSPIPFFTILLFGYLAYSSFVAFEVYQHRRPW